jgi:predicted enzyme related to lactoylglutathione lyase
MIGGGARVFVGGPEQDVAMTVTARLDLAIFDAADIDKVGSFYAELTGWDVARKDSDRFGLRTPDGQEIEFQRAPDHVAPQWPGQEHPQQFHLDLRVADLAAGEAQVLAAGATRHEHQPSETGGFVVYLDPAGHPFCLCLTASGSQGQGAGTPG